MACFKLGICMYAIVRLTIVCLKGLGLDYLTAEAAHHQVEVVLCGTLAKYRHVCTQGKNEPERAEVRERQISWICIYLVPQLEALCNS